MLHFPAWKIALIVGTLLWGAFLAFPNAVSDPFLGIEPPPPTSEAPEAQAEYRAARAAAEQAWWPGFLPNSKLNLGLDLRGGVYLLMEIDPAEVVRNHLEVFQGDATRALNRDRGAGLDNLPRTRVPEIRGETLPIQFRDAEDVDEAIRRLQRLNQPVAGAIGGQRSFEISRRGADTVVISVSDAARSALTKDALRKTMEIVRRRIDPDGVSEISIQPQGDTRIVLEAPGEPDPTRLKNILSQAGRMTFNLADRSPSNVDAALAGVEFPGYRLLQGEETGPILIESVPIITGSDIATANQGYDEGNRPNIQFRLTGRGSQRFGRATAANVNKPFAIVLDDRVMSAPNINEPIYGGNVQITGSFTIAEAQDLAAIIEAGELPAKIGFIEERTVGPSLGEDSIRAGATASLIGLALVAIFMIIAYGLMGGYAVASLAANIVLILGVLSGFGATLTLPGIAGIILTIGMAVDANVLVFERIREERASGRSPVTAVQAGYERALSTILDANITTFIAASILYMLGSGPVKGFAVTLAIGILTSVFTAFVVTRWFTATWLRLARPKKLSI